MEPLTTKARLFSVQDGLLSLHFSGDAVIIPDNLTQQKIAIFD
jgi:hypothetical protein